MSTRKPDDRPDLRHQGVIVGREADGSLFDLGRYGELEALGMATARRGYDLSAFARQCVRLVILKGLIATPAEIERMAHD